MKEREYENNLHLGVFHKYNNLIAVMNEHRSYDCKITRYNGTTITKIESNSITGKFDKYPILSFE